MRATRQAAALAALVLAAISPALGQGSSYYQIVSVNAAQISNAVRITVRADGAIRASAVLRDYLRGDDLDSGFEEISYPPVDRVRISLEGARSMLGSFVPVNQYPVSHIEFSIPPGPPQSFRMDMEVVLFRKSRMRRFDLEGAQTEDALPNHGDPNWFEVVEGSDRRSIIITVASDRQPLASERRKPSASGPGALEIWSDGGGVGLHAAGARLSDVVRALSEETGKSILLDSGLERVVTAELPAEPLEELLQQICRGYGLGLRVDGNAVALSDVSRATTASYPAARAHQVPLRWLKPEAARDLLPSCLLGHVRIDEENNSLLVHGPDYLAERVAADIMKLDRPPEMIEVEAVLVESGSSRGLIENMRLDMRPRGGRVATTPEMGDIFVSAARGIDGDAVARLRALDESGKATVRARSSVTAICGRPAEFFSGQSTYIQVQRPSGGEVAIPVNAGVSVDATCFTGGGEVTMDVEVKVGNVAATDALTGLPSVDTRSVSGTVRARPGETIIVGGLKQTSQQKLKKRLPILGYLPIIGQFFRYESRASDESEATVLLTPRIARPEQKTAEGPSESGVEGLARRS